MLARFGKLNTRLALVIGSILIVFLTVDIVYSYKSTKDTAIHEVERWSVLLAETVRVSLNTLMKEQKMDARFTLMDSMRNEIPGFEVVRVIRGERVNKIFTHERETKMIPREQAIIDRATNKIADLTEKLKTTKDPYDRSDYESAIRDAQSDINSSQSLIKELQIPLKVDEREMVKDEMDRKVLDTGKPQFLVEGDKLQVWSPYIAQKQCGAAGGCHVGIEVGQVLGAVHMQFSLEVFNKEARRSAIISAVSKIILSLLIIGTLMFMITRIIIRQIGGEPDYAADVVRQVAQGDLTAQVMTREGDSTSLLASLRGMVTRLSELVGDVRSTTDAITTASQEVAAGNNDLSQRTEEQASSLQETAASMEELTVTVKQNADNAKQANQLAANASDIAVKGGMAVGEAVQTMASISSSSKKIVDIISVIEGIAFQTNILALNAAVEAARAGEQGRGFAVVASEVRNLAQRSAAAAKEIKALIGDSVDKVEAGSKQVNQAGATMDEIVSAVKRVTDIMSEIAAASNEQSSGIDQVNQAITQMDEVTQQNAALVEEAAAAAESMQEQANNLYAAVSIFKLAAAAGNTQTVIAGPSNPAITHDTSTAIVNEKRGRKLVESREEKDGDWKEF